MNLQASNNKYAEFYKQFLNKSEIANIKNIGCRKAALAYLSRLENVICQNYQMSKYQMGIYLNDHDFLDTKPLAFHWLVHGDDDCPEAQAHFQHIDDLSINTRNLFEMSVFAIAIENGKLNFANILLENNNLNVNAWDSFGVACWQIAADKGYADIFGKILDKSYLYMQLQEEQSNIMLYLAQNQMGIMLKECFQRQFEPLNEDEIQFSNFTTDISDLLRKYGSYWNCCKQKEIRYLNEECERLQHYISENLSVKVVCRRCKVKDPDYCLDCGHEFCRDCLGNTVLTECPYCRRISRPTIIYNV